MLISAFFQLELSILQSPPVKLLFKSIFQISAPTAATVFQYRKFTIADNLLICFFNPFYYTSIMWHYQVLLKINKNIMIYFLTTLAPSKNIDSGKSAKIYQFK